MALHSRHRRAVSSDTATKGDEGGATRALFAATQENLPLHILTRKTGGHLEGAGIGTAWTGRGNFGRTRTVKIVSARAGLIWSKTFSAELAAKGFEQCQADPCVFRRVLRGKVVVIIVVYVDDLLVASETKRGEERLVASLTATSRSGVRSGACTVYTSYRLQCGMPN